MDNDYMVIIFFQNIHSIKFNFGDTNMYAYKIISNYILLFHIFYLSSELYSII